MKTFEGNRERLHCKVAEASRRASCIEDRLTKQKSESNGDGVSEKHTKQERAHQDANAAGLENKKAEV